MTSSSYSSSNRRKVSDSLVNSLSSSPRQHAVADTYLFGHLPLFLYNKLGRDCDFRPLLVERMLPVNVSNGWRRNEKNAARK
jgi:hypothetical protein